jgi:hypothetical protein
MATLPLKGGAVEDWACGLSFFNAQRGQSFRNRMMEIACPAGNGRAERLAVQNVMSWRENLSCLEKVAKCSQRPNTVADDLGNRKHGDGEDHARDTPHPEPEEE